MLVTMMPEQLLIITVMTGLHGKKELNSLKMLVFRSLSPGQLKLYPAVPKTEAMIATRRGPHAESLWEDSLLRKP